MCERLLYLVPLVLVLGLVSVGEAQVDDPSLAAWWRLGGANWRSNGASWQGRPEEGQASVNTDATDPVAPPYWVRIDRSGNTLTEFLSPDGETWTQLGDPREVVMADPVLIGLAVTSHNANQATSAQFSNVSFTGNVTGAWQVAEIGEAQPAGNTPESVYVAFEDAGGSVAVVTHPDAALSARSGWTEWVVPYTELSGINLSNVQTMYIGVGNRNNPASGGKGTVFIDDIGYGRPASVAAGDEAATP